ncbi:MAG: DEAD/DEAH box helicase family protein [Campylobacterota bacterium]|nr:DEAD/DEAH box helicase family protein [Campylobacterota bacterium]
MSNFSFLKYEFESLSNEAIKSESNVIDDPEVSAIYARKALEKTVKLIYNIDEYLDSEMTKKSDLITLIKHDDFIDILPEGIDDELHFIRKVGNQAVHGNHVITSKNSLYANKCLYKFQKWMVEVYSTYEVADDYDVLNIASTSKDEKETLEDAIENTKTKEIEEENEALKKELEELRELKQKFETQISAPKQTKKSHKVNVKDISEKETREQLIDIELKEAGYDISKFTNGEDIEYKLTLEDGTTGYADYVIWDEDGTPLAVIEAKKASKDVNIGKHQATLYADALSKKFDTDILVFVTNGRVIEYTNGLYPFRQIHSIFPKDELKRAIFKKKALQTNKPSSYDIDDKITDRTYQQRVINSVLQTYEANKLRALLVMATGTGKTRVSASLSDVLIRSGWVRKVLFLADRVELVKQAKNNYSDYLSETCVNLVEEKELSARMHFGTYETVHNLISKGKYNSAYFDLIIVDEAHRTIYKKYKAIFEYFDSFILGLTATPAGEVHRDTYRFFETNFEEPTDSYDLKTAIKDTNLIDYEPYEIDLGIVKRGIKYKELSEDEKEEFEDKFEEFEEIDASEINKRVLNWDTNEKVLEYLYKHGLHIDEGNKLGKTIIFAKNKQHAEFLKEVYDKRYPKHSNDAQIIHSEISHVSSLIDNFKNPNKQPQIAISVDMLDTGIDVPEILNLVFFKPIKSKIKFDQMIGRGTRLCPNLLGEGKNKEKFYIFDFCQNFTYFDIKPKGKPSSNTNSLRERLFLKKVSLLKNLKEGDFKKRLYSDVKTKIDTLDTKAYNLKKHRHIIQEVQSADLNYITDKLYSDIKTIAEYIENDDPSYMQQYELLVLNTQEAVINKKGADKYKDEIKQRAFNLRAKAKKVNAVKVKLDTIESILDGNISLDSIEDLELVKVELKSLANLSNNEKIDPVKTTFVDKIENVKKLSSKKL